MINRLCTFLADPGAILDAFDKESHSGSGCSQLIERGRQLAEQLAGQTPNELKAMLMALLCRGARLNMVPGSLSALAKSVDHRRNRPSTTRP